MSHRPLTNTSSLKIAAAYYTYIRKILFFFFNSAVICNVRTFQQQNGSLLSLAVVGFGLLKQINGVHRFAFLSNNETNSIFFLEIT
jgi:hypothetical protein